MKSILKKFLLIFVIGILSQPCIENTCWGMEDEQETEEEYHMDLPDGYDSVYKVEAKNNLLEIECRSYDKESEQIYIYFPRNAKQPTTEDAVKWSCANAEDKAITDWYMKMFGVIPYKGNGDSDDDYIKAGYDEANNSIRIISFLRKEHVIDLLAKLEIQINKGSDSISNIKGLLELAKPQKSQLLETINELQYIIKGLEKYADKDLETALKELQNLFLSSFEKIASTSVGRVLLYRILIEIRRKDNGGNGREENNKSNVEIRNAARFLQIYFDTENSFSHPKVQRDSSNGCLLNANVKFDSYSKIKFNDSVKETTVIGKAEPATKKYHIVKKKRNHDIALFHEICHWFHFIRDSVRFSKENEENSQISTIKDFYYFVEPDILSASDMAWTGFTQDNDKIHFLYEEIRNILGMTNSSQFTYLNGDDLCENLYRICINDYIRFGHSDEEYMENDTVVKKAMQTINTNKTLYNISNGIKKSEKSCEKSNNCSILRKSF